MVVEEGMDRSLTCREDQQPATTSGSRYNVIEEPGIYAL
jgi:hypothetical protein